MPWFGWLIIGSLACLVIVLLFFRKKIVIHGITDKEREELVNIGEESKKEQLQAEQKKTEQLAKLVETQQEKLTSLKELYNQAREKINENEQKRFEKYLDDPSIINDELDRILGISDQDDIDTSPERPSSINKDK